MATQYITRMKITTIVQNDVTYVLSDEPVRESGIDYVYVVNGKICTYMDCIVENTLGDMVRTRVLWHYPKEQPNEYPKLIQNLVKEF
jgi:hypothetical protein